MIVAASAPITLDRERATALIRRDIEQARVISKEGYGSMSPGDPRVAKALETKENALRLLESGKPVGPRTYEVNLNAQPEQFLDWDKPLAQMGDPVRKALADAWLAHPEAHAHQIGGQIYESAGDRAECSAEGRFKDRF